MNGRIEEEKLAEPADTPVSVSASHGDGKMIPVIEASLS